MPGRVVNENVRNDEWGGGGKHLAAVPYSSPAQFGNTPIRL